MKKLFLGLSVLGGLAFAQAQAQEKQEHQFPPKEGMHCQNCPHQKGEKTNRGERAKVNPMEMLQKDLNLSDEQVKQIKALHEKEQKEREKEMAQRKTQFEQKRENHKKEMKKILTADQFKKWEEKMEKGRPMMHHKKGEKRQHQNQ